MFCFADSLLLLSSHWDKETEFCGYILSYKDTNSILGTLYLTVITLWRHYFQILPHCMYNIDLGARGWNSLICSVRNAMIIFTGPFLLHHTHSAKGHCGFSVLTPGLFKSYIFSLKLSPPPRLHQLGPTCLKHRPKSIHLSEAVHVRCLSQPYNIWLIKPSTQLAY